MTSTLTLATVHGARGCSQGMLNYGQAGEPRLSGVVTTGTGLREAVHSASGPSRAHYDSPGSRLSLPRAAG
jgi:hypothetical protein